MTPDLFTKDWPHDQPVDDDPLAGFEDFWDAYPRREGKRDAQKAWRQIKAGLDPELRERIMAGVASRPWSKERTFQMLPATFLRGARFDDEVDAHGARQNNAPANRWMPSRYESWCEHDPRCPCPETHALMLAREGKHG